MCSCISGTYHAYDFHWEVHFIFMFHTLDGESLNLVEQKRAPVKVQLPLAKLTKFVGSRARSTLGCLTCRKLKCVIYIIKCYVLRGL